MLDSQGLPFNLTSWSACALGCETMTDWRHWDGASIDDEEGAIPPTVKEMPMMLRRRLTSLGKMALKTAYDAGACNSARLVFSSRYGESDRTLPLLQDLAQHEPLSPMGFSLSVHNSIVGLLSIGAGNKASHNAISAGKESFCAGLVEAVSLLVEDPAKPVLLIHADMPLNDFYADQRDPSVPSLALSLLIEACLPGKGAPYSFGLSQGQVDEGDKQDIDAALSFLKFLSGTEKTWEWQNRTNGWWCKRHAEQA